VGVRDKTSRPPREGKNPHPCGIWDVNPGAATAELMPRYLSGMCPESSDRLELSSSRTGLTSQKSLLSDVASGGVGSSLLERLV